MLSLLTPELLSLLSGGFMGFLIKMWAQNAADKQALFERLIQKAEVEDKLAENAAKRATGKAGEITRRIIILSILFGVILGPFILTLLRLPVIVEITSPTKSFLGVFEWGGQTKFYELYGYLITPEIRQSLLALIGFYFGVSAGKRSNS